MLSKVFVLQISNTFFHFYSMALYVYFMHAKEDRKEITVFLVSFSHAALNNC